MGTANATLLGQDIDAADVCGMRLPRGPAVVPERQRFEVRKNCRAFLEPSDSILERRVVAAVEPEASQVLGTPCAAIVSNVASSSNPTL